MRPSEPLSGIASIRTRLALLVGASVLVAAVVGTVGTDAGVPLWLGLPVTIALALVVTQWLAYGLTRPLREMTDAADQMAKGDYDVQVSTTGRDEVGQLARAFTLMARDLGEAEEHRRRLVATVAHELRTPLTAQQALLENLVDGVVAPDDAALQSALAQSERLGHLVGDLLDLSRADGRGTPINRARFPLRPLLQDAVAEAELQGRDVHLVLDLVPDDLEVSADRARVAQVVANLLDNAIRHSPTAGTVTISARSEGEQWSLTVADDGPGIDPERAERLFDRFGAGGADAGGGTGLGLAIAGWVAAMHGGSMAALPPALDGRPGARLRLTLPTSPAPHPSASTGATTPKETTVTLTPAPPPGAAHTSHPPHLPTPAAPTPAAPTRAWWPETNRSPRPDLVAAALGVGVLAAAVLPDSNLGVGMLLVLAAGGLAIWLASPRRATRWSWLTAALALPLGLTTVLRAGGGFTFVAVLVAGVLAAVACTGTRTITGMLASVLAWPASGLRGLPMLDRTVRSLARRGSFWPALRIAAVSLVLLLVFGGLLASADAVLGSWASHLLPSISDSVVFRVFVLVFFAGVTLCGLYLAVNPPPVRDLAPSALVRARIPQREWQVPLLVVIAVFVAFLLAQGAALLGGHDYVMRTTGLTYAESARQGFGQLTLATGLTLLLVAGVRAFGRVGSRRDEGVMRGLSATLVVLALVVVGSALHRMALYQEAYGWTVLRVTADLIEVWLGLVLLATLVATFMSNRRWVARAALVSAAVLVALWGVLPTSSWVAERNIARYEATGQLDLQHLRSLGDDAVPAIHDSTLPADLKACVLATEGTWTSPDGSASGGSQQAGAGSADGPFGWNLARERAQDIRSGYTMPTSCPSTDEVGRG